uniref:Helix-turn-helix domain-containing protein n=1 Tax=Yoonia rhodophyticola TaxID=3137370 RepID=A0AAN0M5V2_9RHOB
MAFTKLSIGTAGADASRGPISAAETDIWTIFRALRDARSVFGLRPGHIQTLQAMLSFLKPGHGETVFASNNSICQRVGGIDERTLRRHINRFVELGFIKRNDSSNRKRYRVRSSGGHCISYGLSLAPSSSARTSLSPSHMRWKITDGIGYLPANRSLQSSPIWKSMIPATHSSTTHGKLYAGS